MSSESTPEPLGSTFSLLLNAGAFTFSRGEVTTPLDLPHLRVASRREFLEFLFSVPSGCCLHLLQSHNPQIYTFTTHAGGRQTPVGFLFLVVGTLSSGPLTHLTLWWNSIRLDQMIVGLQMLSQGVL